MSTSALKGAFYSLEVDVLEDLHTGTGMGRGELLDRAQATGRDGRPVIRATHVKGLLVEAAREIVELSGDATKKAKAVALLGGSGTTRGQLVMESLRLEGKSCDFRVWGASARALGGRSPQEDTLHTTECIPAGSKFRAKVLLRDASLVEFLRACLKRIDSLGAKRRRGTGLVKIELKETSHEEGSRATVSGPELGQRVLRMLLRARDPLALAATGAPGNLIPSECFIRGQTLRGSLARWAIENLGPLRKGGDHDPAETILGKSIRVGDAVPLPDAKPAGLKWTDTSTLAALDVIPVPLLVGAPKGSSVDSGEAPWWLGSSTAGWLGADHGFGDRFEGAEGGNLKRPDAHDFLCRVQGTDDRWLRYSPAMGVHLRNGVPTGKRGEPKTLRLFAEEEIAEGTCFVADLRCLDNTTAKRFYDQFRTLLEGRDWLTIGRSGRPVSIDAACWFEPDGRCEAPAGMGEQLNDSEAPFTLVLVSDLISRGPYLGFDDALDPRMVLRLLDASVTGHDESGMRWRAICDVEEIRGFNGATGLRRAPALAIRRGSAIRIEGPGSARLKALLEQRLTQADPALGERREEGFGRYRLDFRIEPGKKERKLERTSGTRAASDEIDKAEELRAEARRLAEDLAAAPKGPSASQWRALVEACRHQPVLEVLGQVREQATKLGGKRWDAVAGKLKELEQKLANDKRSERERKDLVETTILWLMTMLKERSAAKSTPVMEEVL